MKTLSYKTTYFIQKCLPKQINHYTSLDCRRLLTPPGTVLHWLAKLLACRANVHTPYALGVFARLSSAPYPSGYPITGATKVLVASSLSSANNPLLSSPINSS